MAGLRIGFVTGPLRLRSAIVRRDAFEASMREIGLQVRPEFGQVVGVDIGETHLQVGLFDCALATIATTTYPIAETRLDPELVAKLVLEALN